MNVLVQHDHDTESAEFQLPMQGLYADLEMGQGSVRLPDEFHTCSAAVQVEVIGHWQRALAGYRNGALVQMYKELANAHPQLDEGERLSIFRSTCESLGIDVPADFARHLPQY